MEITGIVGLTAIALKRNNDCYKAECELIAERFGHNCAKIDLNFAQAMNEKLVKENKELKEQLESKGEEA